MPTYEYVARDREGNTSSGVLIAENENQLRQSLRIKELFVTTYSVRADHHAKPAGTFSIFKPRRVKLNEMVVMSRQMSTLVRAGLSVVETLDTVASQTENPILADAL